MKKFKILGNAYLFIIMAIMYVPIIYLLVFAFNDGVSMNRFEGFTIDNFKALFEDENLMTAVYATIIIAILATVISVIIGTFAAISISRLKKGTRDSILFFNNLPIVNPDVVTALAIFLLFSALPFSKGYVTMLLAHISFCTPYVIINVYPKLKSLDPNLLEAAQDLGAKPSYALRKVLLPQLKASIFGAAGIAFTMSFDDYIISSFVKGSTATNISIYLYGAKNALRSGLYPKINALSSIIIFTILLLVVGKIVIDKFRNNEGEEED